MLFRESVMIYENGLIMPLTRFSASLIAALNVSLGRARRIVVLLVGLYLVR